MLHLAAETTCIAESSSWTFLVSDRFKAVLLLWIICVIYVLCFSCFRVCSLLPCGHLLGKGWPFDSCLWCLIVFLSIYHVVPGSVWYLIASIPDFKVIKPEYSICIHEKNIRLHANEIHISHIRRHLHIILIVKSLSIFIRAKETSGQFQMRLQSIIYSAFHWLNIVYRIFCLVSFINSQRHSLEIGTLIL